MHHQPVYFGKLLPFLWQTITIKARKIYFLAEFTFVSRAMNFDGESPTLAVKRSTRVVLIFDVPFVFREPGWKLVGAIFFQFTFYRGFCGIGGILFEKHRNISAQVPSMLVFSHSTQEDTGLKCRQIDFLKVFAFLFFFLPEQREKLETFSTRLNSNFANILPRRTASEPFKMNE